MSGQVDQHTNVVSHGIHAVADGLDAFWLWLMSWSSNEAQATVLVGVLAAVIAITAIWSQRASARRQATISRLERLSENSVYQASRLQFRELARRNGGMARFAHPDPFSEADETGFIADITKELELVLAHAEAQILGVRLVETHTKGDPEPSPHLATDLFRELAKKRKKYPAQKSKRAKGNGIKKVARRIAAALHDRNSVRVKWKEGQRAIDNVLNAHELTATGVHNGALDFKVLKQFSRSTLSRDYTDASAYIVELRKVHEYPRFYVEFEVLAREMRGDKLPRRRRWWWMNF